MATFDEVLGHMLARTESANIKKLLSAFNVNETRSHNANILASSKYLLKKDIDPTVEFLIDYTGEFYPHATTIIENTLNSGKQKSEKVTDIIKVLFAVSPTQCRSCKSTYISTSPENSDANLNCLLCGRRSHATCYKDYVIDNSVGIVFLCDPCLSTSETAALDDEESDEEKDEEHVEPNNKSNSPDNKSKKNPSKDEICKLYRENSCPHGLTGKREIDGKPCPFRHPPKCFYHIGKYGDNGCRYTAKRCPFFHPELCENSTKMKVCLNKECKKYHLTGTKRTLNDQPQKEEYEKRKAHRKEEKTVDHRTSSRQRSNTSVWEKAQDEKDPIVNNENPSNVKDKENINAIFLGCIQQLNANILQMKADMNKSVREVVQTTLAEKGYLSQNQSPYNIPMLYLQPQNKVSPPQNVNLQSPTPTHQQIPVSSLQQTSH